MFSKYGQYKWWKIKLNNVTKVDRNNYDYARNILQ